MDFIVRVVKNIGSSSEETFGSVGSLCNVINKKLIDKDGYEWSAIPLESIEHINDCFSGSYNSYATKFEFVENIEEDKIEEVKPNSLYSKQLKNIADEIENLRVEIFQKYDSSEFFKKNDKENLDDMLFSIQSKLRYSCKEYLEWLEV